MGSAEGVDDGRGQRLLIRPTFDPGERELVADLEAHVADQYPYATERPGADVGGVVAEPVDLLTLEPLFDSVALGGELGVQPKPGSSSEPITTSRSRRRPRRPSGPSRCRRSCRPPGAAVSPGRHQRRRLGPHWAPCGRSGRRFELVGLTTRRYGQQDADDQQQRHVHGPDPERRSPSVGNASTRSIAAHLPHCPH